MTALIFHAFSLIFVFVINAEFPSAASCAYFYAAFFAHDQSLLPEAYKLEKFKAGSWEKIKVDRGTQFRKYKFLPENKEPYGLRLRRRCMRLRWHPAAVSKKGGYTYDYQFKAQEKYHKLMTTNYILNPDRCYESAPKS